MLEAKILLKEQNIRRNKPFFLDTLKECLLGGGEGVEVEIGRAAMGLSN